MSEDSKTMLLFSAIAAAVVILIVWALGLTFIGLTWVSRALGM